MASVVMWGPAFRRALHLRFNGVTVLKLLILLSLSLCFISKVLWHNGGCSREGVARASAHWWSHHLSPPQLSRMGFQLLALGLLAYQDLPSFPRRLMLISSGQPGGISEGKSTFCCHPKLSVEAYARYRKDGVRKNPHRCLHGARLQLSLAGGGDD